MSVLWRTESNAGIFAELYVYWHGIGMLVAEFNQARHVFRDGVQEGSPLAVAQEDKNGVPERGPSCTELFRYEVRPEKEHSNRRLSI